MFNKQLLLCDCDWQAAAAVTNVNLAELTTVTEKPMTSCRQRLSECGLYDNLYLVRSTWKHGSSMYICTHTQRINVYNT